MKTQIRRSVFETNSSSTHSISIVREPTNIHFPTTLEFNVGEFGWEWKIYSDYRSKASYLYTAILYNTCLESNTELSDGKQKCRAMVNEKLNKIKNALSKYGIKCIFHPFQIKTYNYNDYSNGHPTWSYYPGTRGYIDHGNGLKEWINTILNDETLLINFLFDNSSVIETGNDNEECPWREYFDEFEDLRSTNKYYTYIKSN